MTSFMRKWPMGRWLAAAVLVGAVAFTPSAARADFEITFTVDGGAGFLNVVDNGAGDTDPTVGVIVVGQQVLLPGFSFLSTTATSNFAQPGRTDAFLQISTVGLANSTTAAHSIEIFVTSTDFDVPDSPPPATLFSTASGSVLTGTLSNITFESFADPTNAEYGTAFPAPILSFGSRGASQSYSDLSQRPGYDANPLFSLSNRGFYTVGPRVNAQTPAQVTQVGGNSQLVLESVPVPGPSGLALALAGLPCVGLWLRRRIG